MEKKELEDRATIKEYVKKVKVEATVNVKQEPEIEHEVEEDNIKVKVEPAKVDKRPRTLGVFGIGRLIMEKDLLEEFKVFGDLEGANIVRDHVTGTSKGYGFVKFLDPV